MPTAQDPTVTFRLDRKLKETLAGRAKELGVSLSDLIREELAVLGGAVAGSGDQRGAAPTRTAAPPSAPPPRASETVHFEVQPQPEERVKKILSSAKCRCGATRQAGAMCPNCKWVAR
jgi:hypothetical protein